MTTEEYIEACSMSNWEKSLPQRQEFNRQLIEEYPFLKPNNPYDDLDNFNYEYTLLDDMPDGWRIAFADDMMKELKEELDKFNYTNSYYPVQIKEKFGGLRWYDNGCPEGCKVGDIIRKYEDLSFRTCINCGKPAKYLTTGWIIPLCEDCAKNCGSEVKPITEDDLPKWMKISE